MGLLKASCERLLENAYKKLPDDSLWETLEGYPEQSSGEVPERTPGRLVGGTPGGLPEGNLKDY